MKSIVLNIPDSGNFNAFDISVYLAAKMYEDGVLSSGQAADMIGLTKRAFIEIMGKYGVSVFSNNIDDLKNDFVHA
jgi:hypothetical protein